MTIKKILNLLPYSPPFLFVDEIYQITDDGVKGCYTFKPTEFFYEGHFKNLPVTPGVILTETMTQIGLVCLGIYLLRDEIAQNVSPEIALTAANVEFLTPVFPGEKVIVSSKKEYFRFGKLKCKVEMRNSEEKIVCTGVISGMIKNKK